MKDLDDYMKDAFDIERNYHPDMSHEYILEWMWAWDKTRENIKEHVQWIK